MSLASINAGERERDGIVPTIEDSPLFDKLICVHRTDWYPDNGEIHSHASNTSKYNPFNGVNTSNRFMPRYTVHFSLNGAVRQANGGIHNWESRKYTILCPLRFLIDGNMLERIHSVDTYFLGNVRIPKEATILSADKIVGRRADCRHREIKTTLQESVTEAIKDYNGFEMQLNEHGLSYPLYRDGISIMDELEKISRGLGVKLGAHSIQHREFEQAVLLASDLMKLKSASKCQIARATDDLSRMPFINRYTL